MATSGPPSRFRFIQISDLHLCEQPWRINIERLIARNLHRSLDTTAGTSVPANEWNSILRPASFIPEIQRGVAEFCYTYTGKIDGIVISGDLATTGKAADLQIARSFIKDPPTMGPFVSFYKPTLQGIVQDEKIRLLPGNHDRYQDDLGTPGSQNFTVMFNRPHMRNWDGDIGYWTSTKNGRSIGFVYADFSLRRRIQAKDPILSAYGQGRVSAQTLDKLIKRTNVLRERCKAIVWIIHFAPYVCDSRLQLIGFGDVTKAAARLGVLCTICGHTHEQNDVTSDGHRVFCGGSAGAVDAKLDSRIHVLNIVADDRSTKIERQNFKWRWDEHAFVLDGSDSHP